MYVPDTLQRLDNRAVRKHQAKVKSGKETCDFCSEPATHIVEVFNPADELRGLEGAYSIYAVCDQCEENGYPYEETFWCEDCGRLFTTHHSWDILAATIDGELYCQKCALNHIDPVPLGQVIEDLRVRNTRHWHRLNNAGPDREEIWSGEYSDYSDFPGHTSMDTIIAELMEKVNENGLTLKDKVIPLITQGYQFSVVLGIFA